MAAPGLGGAERWLAYPAPAELPPVVLADPALPLISVVTPSYNQGPYIRETIESVLGQGYPNLEYWVVDGGSTDGTLGILRAYEADPRFHWLSEPDRGQADAVNKGWRRCRGALLGWLNSDDTYLPGALATLAGYLAAHPAVDAVFGDALRVSPAGAPLGLLAGRPFDLAAMLDANYLAQPTVLQRRRLVEGMGPLRLDLHYALDFDYYARAALRYRFAYLPQTLATYRMHPGSKTVAGGAAFVGEFAMAVEQLFTAPGLPPALRARRRRLVSDHYLRLARVAVRDGDGPLARRSLLRALCISPLRPRVLGVAVQAIDRRLGTGLYAAALAALRRARILRTEEVSDGS